jgi:hypothetical protein
LQWSLKSRSSCDAFEIIRGNAGSCAVTEQFFAGKM